MSNPTASTSSPPPSFEPALVPSFARSPSPLSTSSPLLCSPSIALRHARTKQLCVFVAFVFVLLCESEREDRRHVPKRKVLIASIPNKQQQKREKEKHKKKTRAERLTARTASIFDRARCSASHLGASLLVQPVEQARALFPKNTEGLTNQHIRRHCTRGLNRD